MTRLSHKEYDRVNRALLRLYEPVTPDHLPARIIEVLESVMPVDFVALCTHDVANDTGDAFMSRPAHEHLLEFVNHLDDFHRMPGVRTGEYFNSPHAFSLMDFMPVDRFRHSAVYETFYKQVDILHHLNLNLNRECNLQFQINVSRGRRAYSLTERFILDLLKPHLTARLRGMAHEHGQHPIFGRASLLHRQTWLLCATGGHVVRRSAGADRALIAVGEKAGDRLPPGWLGWFDECTGGAEGPEALRPLVLRRGRARLLVHCLPNPRSGEHRLVLQKEHADKPALTTREHEVLHWIKAGKTNTEIALILGISPGTVKVHVEHILSKLQVSSRHAAAAL